MVFQNPISPRFTKNGLLPDQGTGGGTLTWPLTLTLNANKIIVSNICISFFHLVSPKCLGNSCLAKAQETFVK